MRFLYSYASILMYIAVCLVLSGCTNHLVFGERTGFNLGVSVNSEAAVPLEVNAGLRRSVFGMVPPRRTVEDSNGNPTADDEAVSLISGFGLKYDPDNSNALNGDLTILTRFASGIAAIKLAGGSNTGTQLTTATKESTKSTVTQINNFVNVAKFLPGEPD
ncbi:MAG: hypothetical protein KDK04_28970 [Candidatus Competibacteraceae bacterium]|nr:hypothetical protein [Candidatus Competibacteraceae bacterium]